jgi:flagellar protein FlbD
MLTRLNGSPFALNPDLIERVERTPDTVITLVDGKHYLVGEGLDEVIDLVTHARAVVLAEVAAAQVRAEAAHLVTRHPAPSTPADAHPQRAHEHAGDVIPMRRNS